MTYSWGRIRFLLRTFAGPNISVDTIDNAIQGRYELILNTLDWKGLEQSAILQTTAAYNAGGINATLGSTTVTGINTNWAITYTGWQLFQGDGPIYTVSITSPTSLELDRPFEGPSGGPAYWIAQAVYNLPDNCRKLRSVFSPYDGSPLDPIDEDLFGELEGSFLPINGNGQGTQSTNYVLWTDGLNGQTGETVQRVLLYPVPVLAQGYPIKYDVTADGFDGESTTDGPLPFVSPGALIAGCKADLEMEKPNGSLQKSQKFEADFARWLLMAVHVENGKRPKGRMRLEDSYTKHRAERYLRSGGPGLTQNWLLNSDNDNLATGAGTWLSETPSGVANGTNGTFLLSQAPLTPVVVSVNGALKTLATNYVASGRIVQFLAGSIPPSGAAVVTAYSY